MKNPKKTEVPAPLDAPHQELLYKDIVSFWGALVCWQIENLVSPVGAYMLNNCVGQCQSKYWVQAKASMWQQFLFSSQKP